MPRSWARWAPPFELGDSGVRFGGRVALGLGGGGDLPTGGGLLARWRVDLSVPLSRDVSLGLEAGWVEAPQGDFSAPFASLALRWALDPLPGMAPVRVREEWSAGAEVFFDAARKDGSTREHAEPQLQVLALRRPAHCT